MKLLMGMRSKSNAADAQSKTSNANNTVPLSPAATSSRSPRQQARAAATSVAAATAPPAVVAHAVVKKRHGGGVFPSLLKKTKHNKSGLKHLTPFQKKSVAPPVAKITVPLHHQYHRRPHTHTDRGADGTDGNRANEDGGNDNNSRLSSLTDSDGILTLMEASVQSSLPQPKQQPKKQPKSKKPKKGDHDVNDKEEDKSKKQTTTATKSKSAKKSSSAKKDGGGDDVRTDVQAPPAAKDDGNNGKADRKQFPIAGQFVIEAPTPVVVTEHTPQLPSPTSEGDEDEGFEVLSPVGNDGVAESNTTFIAESKPPQRKKQAAVGGRGTESKQLSGIDENGIGGSDESSGVQLNPLATKKDPSPRKPPHQKDPSPRQAEADKTKQKPEPPSASAGAAAVSLTSDGRSGSFNSSGKSSGKIGFEQVRALMQRASEQQKKDEIMKQKKKKSGGDRKRSPTRGRNASAPAVEERRHPLYLDQSSSFQSTTLDMKTTMSTVHTLPPNQQQRQQKLLFGKQPNLQQGISLDIPTLVDDEHDRKDPPSVASPLVISPHQQRKKPIRDGGSARTRSPKKVASVKLPDAPVAPAHVEEEQNHAVPMLQPPGTIEYAPSILTSPVKGNEGDGIGHGAGTKGDPNSSFGGSTNSAFGFHLPLLPANSSKKSKSSAENTRSTRDPSPIAFGAHLPPKDIFGLLHGSMKKQEERLRVDPDQDVLENKKEAQEPPAVTGHALSADLDVDAAALHQLTSATSTASGLPMSNSEIDQLLAKFIVPPNFDRPLTDDRVVVPTDHRASSRRVVSNLVESAHTLPATPAKKNSPVRRRSRSRERSVSVERKASLSSSTKKSDPSGKSEHDAANVINAEELDAVAISSRRGKDQHVPRKLPRGSSASPTKNSRSSSSGKKTNNGSNAPSKASGIVSVVHSSQCGSSFAQAGMKAFQNAIKSKKNASKNPASPKKKGPADSLPTKSAADPDVANSMAPAAVDTAAVMASLESTLPSPTKQKRKSPKKKKQARTLRKGKSKSVASPLGELNTPKAEPDGGKGAKKKTAVANENPAKDYSEVQENNASLPREIALSEFDPVSDLDQSIRHFPMKHVIADGSVDVSRLGQSDNGDDSSRSKNGEAERDRYAPLISSPHDAQSPRSGKDPQGMMSDDEEKSEEKNIVPRSEWSIERGESDSTGEVAVEVMLNTCNHSPIGRALLAGFAWRKPRLEGGEKDQINKYASEKIINGDERHKKHRSAKKKTSVDEKETPRMNNATDGKPPHFFASAEGNDTDGGPPVTRGQDPLGLKSSSSKDHRAADPPDVQVKYDHSSPKGDVSTPVGATPLDRYHVVRSVASSTLDDVSSRSSGIVEDPTKKNTQSPTSMAKDLDLNPTLESIEVVADSGPDQLALLTAVSDDSIDYKDRYAAVEQSPAASSIATAEKSPIMHPLPALLSTIHESDSGENVAGASTTGGSSTIDTEAANRNSDQNRFLERLLQFGQDVLQLSPTAKAELDHRMQSLSPLSKGVLTKSIQNATADKEKHGDDDEPEIIDLTGIDLDHTGSDGVWLFDITPKATHDEDEKRRNELDNLIEFAALNTGTSDDHDRYRGRSPKSPLVVVQGTDVSVVAPVNDAHASPVISGALSVASYGSGNVASAYSMPLETPHITEPGGDRYAAISATKSESYIESAKQVQGKAFFASSSPGAFSTAGKVVYGPDEEFEVVHQSPKSVHSAQRSPRTMVTFEDSGGTQPAASAPGSRDGKTTLTSRDHVRAGYEYYSDDSSSHLSAHDSSYDTTEEGVSPKSLPSMPTSVKSEGGKQVTRVFDFAGVDDQSPRALSEDDLELDRVRSLADSVTTFDKDEERARRKWAKKRQAKKHMARRKAPMPEDRPSSSMMASRRRLPSSKRNKRKARRGVDTRPLDPRTGPEHPSIQASTKTSLSMTAELNARISAPPVNQVLVPTNRDLLELMCEGTEALVCGKPVGGYANMTQQRRNVYELLEDAAKEDPEGANENEKVCPDEVGDMIDTADRMVFPQGGIEVIKKPTDSSSESGGNVSIERVAYETDYQGVGSFICPSPESIRDIEDTTDNIASRMESDMLRAIIECPNADSDSDVGPDPPANRQPQKGPRKGAPRPEGPKKPDPPLPSSPASLNENAAPGTFLSGTLVPFSSRGGTALAEQGSNGKPQFTLRIAPIPEFGFRKKPNHGIFAPRPEDTPPSRKLQDEASRGSGRTGVPVVAGEDESDKDGKSLVEGVISLFSGAGSVSTKETSHAIPVVSAADFEGRSVRNDPAGDHSDVLSITEGVEALLSPRVRSNSDTTSVGKFVEQQRERCDTANTYTEGMPILTVSGKSVSSFSSPVGAGGVVPGFDVDPQSRLVRLDDQSAVSSLTGGKRRGPTPERLRRGLKPDPSIDDGRKSDADDSKCHDLSNPAKAKASALKIAAKSDTNNERSTWVAEKSNNGEATNVNTPDPADLTNMADIKPSTRSSSPSSEVAKRLIETAVAATEKQHEEKAATSNYNWMQEGGNPPEQLNPANVMISDHQTTIQVSEKAVEMQYSPTISRAETSKIGNFDDLAKEISESGDDRKRGDAPDKALIDTNTDTDNRDQPTTDEEGGGRTTDYGSSDDSYHSDNGAETDAIVDSRRAGWNRFWCGKEAPAALDRKLKGVNEAVEGRESSLIPPGWSPRGSMSCNGEESVVESIKETARAMGFGRRAVTDGNVSGDDNDKKPPEYDSEYGTPRRTASNSSRRSGRSARSRARSAVSWSPSKQRRPRSSPSRRSLSRKRRSNTEDKSAWDPSTIESHNSRSRFSKLPIPQEIDLGKSQKSVPPGPIPLEIQLQAREQVITNRKRNPPSSPSVATMRDIARFGSLGSGDRELDPPPVGSPTSTGDHSQNWRSSRAALDVAAHSPSPPMSPTKLGGIFADDESQSDESSLLLALTRSEGEPAVAISSTDGSSTNTGRSSLNTAQWRNQALDRGSPSNLYSHPDSSQPLAPGGLASALGARKEFTRSPRLQTVLERLRNRKRLADSDRSVSSNDMDPVDVDELFSRYDNIVKHMVVLDDDRLQRAQEKQLLALENMIRSKEKYEAIEKRPLPADPGQGYANTIQSNPEMRPSDESLGIEATRDGGENRSLSGLDAKSQQQLQQKSPARIRQLERIKSRVNRKKQPAEQTPVPGSAAIGPSEPVVVQASPAADPPTTIAGESDFTTAYDDRLQNSLRQLSTLDEVQRIKERVGRLHMTQDSTSEERTNAQSQQNASGEQRSNEVIDVTQMKDIRFDSNWNGGRTGRRTTIEPVNTEAPPGPILRANSFGSENSTPSQKARDLRQQLDQALKTSAAIRSTQERLGAELTSFKTRFQHRGTAPASRTRAFSSSPIRARPQSSAVPGLDTFPDTIDSYSPKETRHHHHPSNRKPTVVAGSSGSQVSSDLSDSKPSPTATEATLISGQAPPSHSSSSNTPAPIPHEIHRPLATTTAAGANETDTVVSSIRSKSRLDAAATGDINNNVGTASHAGGTRRSAPSPTFDEAVDTFDKLVAGGRLHATKEEKPVQQDPDGAATAAAPAAKSPRTTQAKSLSSRSPRGGGLLPVSPRSRATTATAGGNKSYATSAVGSSTLSYSLGTNTTGTTASGGAAGTSPMSSSTRQTHHSVLSPIYSVKHAATATTTPTSAATTPAPPASPRRRQHPLHQRGGGGGGGAAAAAAAKARPQGDSLAVALMDEDESSSSGDELLSSSGEMDSATGESRTSTSGGEESQTTNTSGDDDDDSSLGSETDQHDDDDEEEDAREDEVKMQQLESIIDGLRFAEERKQGRGVGTGGTGGVGTTKGATKKKTITPRNKKKTGKK